jgi:hypothetical protein
MLVVIQKIKATYASGFNIFHYGKNLILHQSFLNISAGLQRAARND